MCDIVSTLAALCDGEEWGDWEQLTDGRFYGMADKMKELEEHHPEYSREHFEDYYYNGQELILHFEKCGISCWVETYRKVRFVENMYDNKGKLFEYDVHAEMDEYDRVRTIPNQVSTAVIDKLCREKSEFWLNLKSGRRMCVRDESVNDDEYSFYSVGYYAADDEFCTGEIDDCLGVVCTEHLNSKEVCDKVNDLINFYSEEFAGIAD